MRNKKREPPRQFIQEIIRPWAAGFLLLNAAISVLVYFVVFEIVLHCVLYFFRVRLHIKPVGVAASIIDASTPVVLCGLILLVGSGHIAEMFKHLFGKHHD